MPETDALRVQSDGNAVLHLAIVGGGRACRRFLEFIKESPASFLDVVVVGVCDINPSAVGFRMAQDSGIFTTTSYQELFEIQDLDWVIELTNSREMLVDLARHKPDGVGIIDHNIDKLPWSLFNLERRLRNAEEQADLEKEAFDFLLQETNDRILALKPDFTIVEANEAYLKAVQRSREDVIGAFCYQITQVLKAPCSTAEIGSECPLLETLRTGESAHLNLPNLRTQWRKTQALHIAE